MKKEIFKKTFNTADYASSDVHNLMQKALEEDRAEIINAIAYDADISPERLQNEYEGGIDSWFGLGSVMLFELGYTINVQFVNDKIEFTIMS